MIGIIITKKNNRRYPGKHTKNCNGKPLISYTIESAIESVIEIIYVVTDDKAVIDIAESYNNRKIKTIQLSKELSEIGSVNTILHVTKEIHPDKFLQDSIMLLQATSPLRTSEDINKCYDLMSSNDIDFISSVYRIRSIIIENGAIFCARLSKLRELGNWYSDKTFFYLMPEERSIDIDYEYQFNIAEMLMKGIR